MKRNIVINSSRTALVISDHLSGAIKQVHRDTVKGEEIFAFDTLLHICYAYTVKSNGYELIEQEVPLSEFRSFDLNRKDFNSVYTDLVLSVINR